jgi:hypothetical protein
MKMTFGVVVSAAFAAGLIAGLFGGKLIPFAHAAPNRIILIDTDSEIANKCNFDKTIVSGPKYYICVRN